MGKEDSLPTVEAMWTKTGPLREQLKKVDPNNLPDTAFRNWIDQDKEPDLPIQPKPHSDRLVLVRQIDPKTDAIMDDEEMAASVRLLDDSAVLMMLLVGHKGMHSSREITDFINHFSSSGEQIIARKTVRKHLNRLAEAGMLVREESDETRRKEHRFSISEGQGIYLAQAGFLANLSANHTASLRGIFGIAEPGRGEDRYADDTVSHTMDRIRVVRMLNDARRLNGAQSPLPITATYIADKLGIAYQRAAMHLRALEGAGALDYESVNSANGSYQQYRRNPEMQMSHNASELQRTLIDFIENHPDGVNTYLATVYVMSQSQEDQRDIDITEWRREYDRVRKCMYHLSHTKRISPITHLGKDIKMTVGFEPKSDQLQLIRDTVIALFDIRKDDRSTEAEGKKIGARLVRNPSNMAVLAKKILKENKEYRERRTDRLPSPGKIFLYSDTQADLT